MRNSPILSTDVNTTRVIDVSSSAGFSAGDLVYMQNGNGTTTPTTSSAVTFQAVKNLPVTISAHTGTAVMQVYDNTVDPSYAKNSATNGDSAALLTNGNTVHVVCDQGSGNRVLFTILDPNGATVVPFTSAFTVSGAYSGPVASVCALTGGGFVVGGFDASAIVSYAIFDNTGATVLAQQSYGESLADGSAPCCVFGLQNGNWVYAFRSGSNTAIRFAIFSPTGTSILSWTTVSGSTSSNAYQTVATTRSDGSFVIGWINNGNTSISLRQYDSAGTTLGINTITPSESTRNIRCLDLATMSDGSTVRCAFTYYQNDAQPYWKTSYATLTGTTLSAITNLSGQNLTQNTNNSPNTNNGPQSVGIIGLAGGTFLIAYQDMTATIGYAVFNSSGTCLTGTNANGAIPLLIYGSATSAYCVITMFEQGDYINLYYSHGQYSTNAPRGQCFSKINKTTYEVFYPYTVSQNIGSVSASAGAYVKSAAKPTQATFTTQSTFTSVLSRSVGLITDGNTATATSNPSNTSVALIKDGTIISAEHNGSTTLTIARYNNQGVYLSTIATVTGSGGSPRVRALADGGFVVMHYLNSTGTAQFLVYNSSFALVTSFSGGETIATSGTYMFDFDVLKSQNIVWCFQYSANNYVYYKILSLTGTTVSARTQISGGTSYNIRVSAGVNDRFIVTFYYSPGNYSSAYSFIRTGASTWQNMSSWTVSYTGHDATGINPTALPTGPFALFYPYNNTNTYIYIFEIYGNGINIATGFNVSGSVTGGGMAMTLTGLGTIAVYLRTTTNPEQCLGFMGNMGTMNVAYQFPSTNFFFSTSLNPSNNLAVSSFCSAGLTNWFMFYTNASSVKAITLATSLPYANSITFTQNVALCDPLSIYPNSTSASGIIPNCPLVGVALTAAPAGGVGRVVSSGATTLNASYSATTPFGNFDHQTYGGMGVKGFISGRTVTLTGSN